jgi:DNA helicase-4
MTWKQQIHQQYQTTLIETYSYQKTDGVLLSHLEQALKSHGVTFQPIPHDEIFTKINEMGIIRPFIGLLMNFLNLYKSSAFTLDEIRRRAHRYSDWQRYHAFLDVFTPIEEDYTTHLWQTQTIDFNDMINQATHYVTEQKFHSPYKYILVDEFQDLSQSRYRLLKSLLDQNPFCKSLCVGDDWQSIYRFAGSEISHMTHFSEYFDYIRSSYLDRTFRFNNKLCDFSKQFIMQNSNQIPKQLKSNKVIDTPSVTLVWSNSEEKDVVRCLDEISQLEHNTASVFILGRYGFNEPDRLHTIQQQFPNITIQYSTIHKSKGREADYVILVGLKSGRHGFPCLIEDDPILNLVLAKEDNFPNTRAPFGLRRFLSKWDFGGERERLTV